MAVNRIRRTESRREYENLVDDYITQGYEVTERGENSAMLRKKTWGTMGWHILVALLTAWWTIFLGNVAYALMARYWLADQLLVRLEQQHEESQERGIRGVG